MEWGDKPFDSDTLNSVQDLFLTIVKSKENIGDLRMRALFQLAKIQYHQAREFGAVLMAWHTFVCVHESISCPSIKATAQYYIHMIAAGWRPYPPDPPVVFIPIAGY